MHVYSISCTIAIILIVFVDEHNFLVLLYEGMNDNYNRAISQPYVFLHLPLVIPCRSLSASSRSNGIISHIIYFLSH